jgi:acyl carrier protein
MSEVSAADVRALVLEGLAEPLSAKNVSPDDLPDSYDLLAEGVLDSLAILDLILSLEERFALEIDFDGIDPDDLTRIGPLSRYVADASTRIDVDRG